MDPPEGVRKIKKASSLASLRSAFSRKDHEEEVRPPVPPIPRQHTSAPFPDVERFPSFSDGSTLVGNTTRIWSDNFMDLSDDDDPKGVPRYLNIKQSIRNFRVNTSSSRRRTSSEQSSSFPTSSTSPLTQTSFGRNTGTRTTSTSTTSQSSHHMPKTPSSGDGTFSQPFHTSDKLEPRGDVFIGFGRPAPKDIRPQYRWATRTERDDKGGFISKALQPAMPSSEVADIDEDYWREAVKWAEQQVQEQEAHEILKLQATQSLSLTEEESRVQETERLQLGSRFLKRTSRLTYEMDWSQWDETVTDEDARAAFDALKWARENQESAQAANGLSEVVSGVIKRVRNRIASPRSPQSPLQSSSTPSNGMKKPSKVPYRKKQKQTAKKDLSPDPTDPAQLAKQSREDQEPKQTERAVETQVRAPTEHRWMARQRARQNNVPISDASSRSSLPNSSLLSAFSPPPPQSSQTKTAKTLEKPQMASVTFEDFLKNHKAQTDRDLALNHLEGSASDSKMPAGLGIIDLVPTGLQTVSASCNSGMSDIDITKVNENRRQHRLENDASDSSLESTKDWPVYQQSVDKAQYRDDVGLKLDSNFSADASDPYGYGESNEMDPTPSKPAGHKRNRAIVNPVEQGVSLQNTQTEGKVNEIDQHDIVTLLHPAFRHHIDIVEQASLQQQSRAFDVNRSANGANGAKIHSNNNNSFVSDYDSVHAQDFQYGGRRVSSKHSEALVRSSSSGRGSQQDDLEAFPHPAVTNQPFVEVHELPTEHQPFYTADGVLTYNMGLCNERMSVPAGTPRKSARRKPIAAVDSVFLPLPGNTIQVTKTTSVIETLRDDVYRPSRLENHLDEAIDAWQDGTPTRAGVTRESSTTSLSAELDLQCLRHDLEIPLISSEHPLSRPHPNHGRVWNTINIMCFGIHATTENDLYSSTTSDANVRNVKKCIKCGSFCCFYADRLVFSKVKSMDKDVKTLTQKANDQLARLCSKYPSGIEKYATLMKCNECLEIFCPDCGTICHDRQCGMPLCYDCANNAKECPYHKLPEPVVMQGHGQ